MPDDAKKDPEPPFLNTVEAAAWLRLTKNTLDGTELSPADKDAVVEYMKTL
jgi:hypothetical protein